MARVRKALADPVRLRLLSVIGSAEAGEACACDFPDLLGRSQPTIRRHLSQLTAAGPLIREQRGKWAWFRVADHRVEQLLTAFAGAVPGAGVGVAAVRPERAPKRPIPEPERPTPTRTNS